jgi:hypothetical protein
MNDELLEKLTTMEREVAAEKGGFRLFALFLREDSPDRWDLLVSAPWLDANRVDGMDYLAKQVQSRLQIQELISLSRLVFIASDNPGLEAILRSVHVLGGRCEVHNSNFSGLPIKHAYIITANNQVTADQQDALHA